MKQIFFFLQKDHKVLVAQKGMSFWVLPRLPPFWCFVFFFFTTTSSTRKKKLFQKLDMNPVLLLNPSVSCQMLASVSLFQQLAFVHLKGNTNADTENKKCSMAVAESVCDWRGRASSRFLYRHKCLLFVLCATLAAGSLIKCSFEGLNRGNVSEYFIKLEDCPLIRRIFFYRSQKK